MNNITSNVIIEFYKIFNLIDVVYLIFILFIVIGHIEGVHFDLAYVPLKHLGYKAVVVNVSDICAMNAKPTQITVSIAVSNRFPLEALEELYEGITLAANQYKVDVIGGDTTSSQKGLIITALPRLEKLTKQKLFTETELRKPTY